jgi:hypothetical protein
MKTQHGAKFLLAIAGLMVFVVAIACSFSGDDSGYFTAESAGGSANGVYATVVVEKEVSGDSAAGASAPPRAEPAAFATVIVTERGDKVLAFDSDEETQSTGSNSGSGSAAVENEIASATDGRVIVRTADLVVTVDDVTESMDDISKITNAAGGWVVTSIQPRNYQGTISIRVPADRFEDVVDQLSDLAVEVKSVSTRSEDFTEEFTDVTARAQTLDDTLERLRILYDRANTVEDAITIQKEITNVQGDLESLEARLKFLSQSSAFSFISVSLESVPIELVIDGGADIAAAMGHPVTYRAKFTPPANMEEFIVTWNFGDGSREQSTNRVAPTGNGDEVITSPIVHYFERDEDSPFIVTVELNGFGDAGVAEGEDTLVTTVSRLPVIEVFAGESQTVEAGSEVDFSASFTMPDGVSDVSYSWNFGDGSAPVEASIESTGDGSQVDTVHTYQNFRPDPYVAVLTITGQTDVGEVEAVGQAYIFVRETIGVSAAELDAGSTVRDAGRTLQSVGVFLAQAGLWLLILSPAWLVVGGVVFVVVRRRRGSVGIPQRDAE